MIRPLDMFDLYVKVSGTWKWDEQHRVINVQGDVKIKFSFQDFNGVWIPYEFGEVSGDFDCHSKLLTSLYNAPRKVGGSFHASYNPIDSLEDGPKWVGGSYNVASCNQLVNVQDVAAHVGGTFHVNYTPRMHMLKPFIASQRIELHKPNFVNDEIAEGMETTQALFDKYAGQGKPGAIRLAGELIKAGYPDMARM